MAFGENPTIMHITGRNLRPVILLCYFSTLQGCFGNPKPLRYSKCRSRTNKSICTFSIQPNIDNSSLNVKRLVLLVLIPASFQDSPLL